MIGLDTNVLVRYLTQDDPAQSKQANQLFAALSRQNAGFIAHIVLMETVWVLSRCYDIGRSRLQILIRSLLSSEELVIEQAELVWKALAAYDSSSADFSDCLIEVVCREAGCVECVTFDKKASRIRGFRLLPG